MEKAPYQEGDLVEPAHLPIKAIANGCASLPITKPRVLVVARIWWSEIEGHYLVRFFDHPGDWPAEAFYRQSRQRHFATR